MAQHPVKLAFEHWEWRHRRWREGGRGVAAENNDPELRRAVWAAHNEVLALFWPTKIYEDDELTGLAGRLRPRCEGRARGLWDSLVAQTPPGQAPDAAAWREMRFQTTQLVFDCAERFIAYTLGRDKTNRDAETWERRDCVRLTVRHMRFEFETMWAFGRKLIALGHHPRDPWSNPRSLSPAARDLDKRYARALEEAYDKLDQRLRERCGQNLCVLMDVWAVRMEVDFLLRAFGEVFSVHHAPGKAMWPDVTFLFGNGSRTWNPPKSMTDW